MSDLSFNGIRIEHPGARERETGKASTVSLMLSTRQGWIREVDLSREQLIALVRDAAKLLAVVEGVR